MIIDKQIYKDLVKPLGKDIHKRFCTNIDDSFDREVRVYTTPQAIFWGFMWGNTPEGYEYWKRVYQNVSSNKPLLRTTKDGVKQRYEEVVF